MVKQITEHEWYTEYEHAVLNENMTAAIIFGASWCDACQKLKDRINSEALIHPPILYIDVDNCTTLADEHHVTTLPYVVIYENGTVVNEFDNNYPLDDIIDGLQEMV